MGLHLTKMKNDKPTNYYTEIHAQGFKKDRFGKSYANRSFDSACCHFSTTAKIHSEDWDYERARAIGTIGNQQVSHGWQHYRIGKTFVADGSRMVNPFSPEADYHHGRIPTYQEVA